MANTERDFGVAGQLKVDLPIKEVIEVIASLSPKDQRMTLQAVERELLDQYEREIGEIEGKLKEAFHKRDLFQGTLLEVDDHRPSRVH